MEQQRETTGPLPQRSGSLLRSILKSKRLWGYISGALLLIGVMAVGSAYWYIKNLDVSKLNQPLPAPTMLFDRNGHPASQLSASKIDPVPLSQMPKSLTDAVLAVEDKRFYEHSGVDLQAIGRAVVRDILQGGYTEGASTITQQLAKNMFLSTDKTLSRKLREAAYAIKIDMAYRKDEILETYLNSIYFGEGSWGVQGASTTYFGKNVKDLTLAESALLAALPKAPSRYSPQNNQEEAMERRNTVLALMRDQGKITEEAYQGAANEPITIVAEQTADDLKGKYPAYVDAVIQEAVDQYGFTEEQLLTGGLRITTELDPKVQQAVLDVYQDDQLFPQGDAKQLVQSGAVVLDQRSGGIRAVAGGRGNSVFRGFSHATQIQRQPGSSLKPIMVYGPALEKGYTPSSLLYDGPLNINGYQPEDWDHQSRGQVTMDEAVIRSWNVPPVWLLDQIGIDSGLQFSSKLGIDLPKEDRQLAAALGGLSQGVSPLQMAQAFSAFANQGALCGAHTIAKIATSNGQVLIEAKPQCKSVMQSATAAAMTSMLQHAVISGTGKNAAMNRPVAGKSGTTQLPDTKEFAGLDSNAAKDAWFAGYTPELTAAIWVGYDRTDRQHYLTTSGGAVPAVLFREIMTRSLAEVPIVPFDLSAYQPETPDVSQPEHDKPEKNDRQNPREKKKAKGKQGH
ncbi:transglycosylase domain-containing protein [Paenibacillus hexagrammi]|uniref:PBP1A family penicillin-binding protein n=1 Tax=Paenibacillus hexagrammi TaxID=2908839 RepID=A0ABY3SPK6_9BACL|nr:PBP1A family penicillin-binding protein [Paenibacillus sp. YPD9-1]UJF35450.1 PBP1A family penicillin-binding protein [Paenibacillus sp. YPD9-1]